ncbi:AraC family transcriptional regulator [Streptomyces sp. NPDC048253]|uniref:AraC family transcriptional regulator n=1 Tax=Streptomyces sp. NPDC048253 TaxID=3365524 RepID=UPI0037150D57
MIGTMFRSDDVPAEDRFDHWREMLVQTRPSEIVSSHDTDFWAECRLMPLGPVTASPMSFVPTHYRRSAQMVRRFDPEQYQLTLLLDGELDLDHAGRTETLRPRDLHLVDSSRPFDLRSVDDGRFRVVKGVGVDVPKVLLPFPPHRVRDVLGQGFSGREGVGALLADFLVGLDRQAETLQPSDAPRLGTVVAGLLSAWLAQVLDAEAALSPESRQRATMESVKAFILRNLHDPELAPPVIAAAHHISLSYLHRLFQQHFQGETVAALIRRLRVKGAGRDLADPSLHGTPIHTIAVRWGFPRASDFTRAFRSVYGLSPTEFRLQNL